MKTEKKDKNKPKRQIPTKCDEPTSREFLTVMRTILQQTEIITRGYNYHEKVREFSMQDLKLNGECNRLSDEKIALILKAISASGMLSTISRDGMKGINYVLE